jgi:hypothetical protein
MRTHVSPVTGPTDRDHNNIAVSKQAAICLWLYSPLLDIGRFFRRQDLLDGGSARRKASTYTQNNTNTDIHALSWFRTHDPSVRASEYSSCLRPRSHCDRQRNCWGRENIFGSPADKYELVCI